MPNYAWNAAVIEGNKEAYDLVKCALTGEGENIVFDFSKIIPLPQHMEKFSAPVKVVPDKEFEQYMQENYPEGLDTYEKNDGIGLRQVPQSLHDKWIKESGCGDWYDFCSRNWGTKWSGWDVQIVDDKEAEGVIAIIFTTAWCAPIGIYEALEIHFPGCRVHSGVIYEDGMEPDFLAGDENLFDKEFTLKEEKIYYDDDSENEDECDDYYVNRWWAPALS